MLKFSEIFEFSKEKFRKIPILKEFEWFEWFEWFGPSPTEPFNSDADAASGGAAAPPGRGAALNGRATGGAAAGRAAGRTAGRTAGRAAGRTWKSSVHAAPASSAGAKRMARWGSVRPDS